jgi:peptide/nickel transport system substrate-binding protein
MTAWVGTSCIGDALAMGRIPVGGELAFQLPQDTSSLDPYDLFDPLAAILGSSVFEPVFRYDRAGNLYPSLAEGMPVREGAVTRVRLRAGLVSGRGDSLLARDLIESVERSRRAGGSAVLLGVPRGTVDRSDGRVASFRNMDPMELALALASPIVALSSIKSTPGRPDGTGAFVANPGANGVVLERNARAARGAAFLRRIRIAKALDMKAPLRAFEAHKADIGWLGAGLHQPRTDAVPFDLGSVGWIVLRTGREAGSWDAPGVAQRLLDAIEPSRLAHLALGPLPPSTAPLAWGGPSCKLIAPARSAHLVEVANTLASILSRSGHDVEMSALAHAEFTSRRASRSHALMVDVVRPVGPAGMATLVALATADDPARARSIVQHPPRLGSFDPRVLTRTLHLGVVGGLRVAGASAPPLVVAPFEEGDGWDLGGTYRRR